MIANYKNLSHINKDIKKKNKQHLKASKLN